MTFPPALLFFAIALLLLLGLIAYWLIVVTEGTYLGAGAVRWLYDRGASSYDGVKQYDDADEAAFVANPLFSRLEESAGPRARLLDVATGTGRLPHYLLAIPFYEGDIVGVDSSRAMLRVAARTLAEHGERVALIHCPSVPLPFEEGSFDAVSCLEALEFMPSRQRALSEMVRVLKPGGWLLVTNRIGTDARLMPGKTDSPERFEQRLGALGLEEVLTRPWQVYYDLIVARKPGVAAPATGEPPWQRHLTQPVTRAADGLWEL